MKKDEIKKQIHEAIARDPEKGDIQKALLFGSYLHGAERDDSDVDVLIEFKPTASIGLFRFVRLQRRISDFVGKKIDLLTPASLSRFFREEVTREAEIIYEGR